MGLASSEELKHERAPRPSPRPRRSCRHVGGSRSRTPPGGERSEPVLRPREGAKSFAATRTLKARRPRTGTDATGPDQTKRAARRPHGPPASTARYSVLREGGRSEGNDQPRRSPSSGDVLVEKGRELLFLPAAEDLLDRLAQLSACVAAPLGEILPLRSLWSSDDGDGPAQACFIIRSDEAIRGRCFGRVN